MELASFSSAGTDFRIRPAEPSDYPLVMSVLNEWWGGRDMTDRLPRLFFIHFRETTFVVQRNGVLVGFLAGFLSQTFPNEAYIHFVTVAPTYRKFGVARLLYERFFETARRYGRNVVRCVTSPNNKTSIVFHQHMGFNIDPGDAEADGVPVHRKYDGTTEDRVLLVKLLHS